ncbi:MAG: sigma-70 family RNA polymerase sigma factor [Deltaproteobacteria bacterium]|nr:sigma-70 family RNA polymerase sigma factor [Deltaproteobacteria bacterium]
MTTESHQITQLLQQHREGDPKALESLIPLVYPQLQRMARVQLRKGGSLTLDTVGLVHEAYLRLVKDMEVHWQDREHFFAVLTRAMRFIVIDQLRERQAQKRGGDVERVTLDAELVGDLYPLDAALTVSRVVDQLATFNERLAKVVECRFFVGMDDREIGEALGLSERTVQRDWLKARAWLHRALEETRRSGGLEASQKTPENR